MDQEPHPFKFTFRSPNGGRRGPPCQPTASGKNRFLPKGPRDKILPSFWHCVNMSIRQIYIISPFPRSPMQSRERSVGLVLIGCLLRQVTHKNCKSISTRGGWLRKQTLQKLQMIFFLTLKHIGIMLVELWTVGIINRYSMRDSVISSGRHQENIVQ